MKLVPKNYTPKNPEIAKVALDKGAVKAMISAFVKEPRSYNKIVNHVQKKLATENKHFRPKEILAVIKEVKSEWHPVETKETEVNE